MSDHWQELYEKGRGAWHLQRQQEEDLTRRNQLNQYSSGSSNYGSSNNWLNNSSNNTSSSYSNGNYSSYNTSSGSSAPSKPWDSCNWFEKLVRVFIEIPLIIVQLLFALWIIGGIFYPPLHEALTPIIYTLWQILCGLLQALGEILCKFQ